MVLLTNKADLINALSLATVVQIYDDNRDGVADDAPIEFNAKRADAQVRSWIIGHYTVGSDIDTDDLLRACALDFLVAYSFERHPEYIRTFGEGPRAERVKRAEATLGRIKEGIQRPVQAETAQKAPSKTVGGVIIDRGGRMYLPNADGTSNAGDF